MKGAVTTNRAARRVRKGVMVAIAYADAVPEFAGLEVTAMYVHEVPSAPVHPDAWAFQEVRLVPKQRQRERCVLRLARLMPPCIQSRSVSVDLCSPQDRRCERC